ncbi:MAG TPA: hypothetical protein VNX70_20060 [Bryobacteraceae bacterium]|nr:hypothetical protein [Bryobacteraceae bacterium]
MGFLPELLYVQVVNQPMHSQQHVGLVAPGIDSLGDRDQPDPREAKMINDVALITLPARESACVVDQDDVELARLFLGASQKSLQAWTISAGAGQLRVGIDVFLQHHPTLTGRIFAAHAHLIQDRHWTLQVGRVAGVNCAAQVHAWEASRENH